MSIKLADIDWGNDSAERDPNLLSYFVTPTDYDKLVNLRKSIITGRKGSGKSALRTKLVSTFSRQPEAVVCEVLPSFPMMQSILRDNSLRDCYGEEVFFQYVWLLHFYRTSLIELGKRGKGSFCNGSGALARELTLTAGQTTPDLLESITLVLEKIKIKAGKLGELGLEITKTLQEATSLSALEYHIFEFIKSGQQFFFFIDDLDVGWDNSELANNLLLGLLSATNYLKAKSQNVHSFVFLRDDMYRLLMQRTQHSDKYRDILQVRWDITPLREILMERIRFFFRQSGDPNPGPIFENVFPRSIGITETMKWMHTRTLNRPRELLQLARIYTEGLRGDQPDGTVLKKVEDTYSNWKLDDLCAEYRNQFPDLKGIFDYWKTHFDRNKYQLSKEEFQEKLFEILEKVPNTSPWFFKMKEEVDVDGLARVLFDIGFIGDLIRGGDGGTRTVYSTSSDAHVPKLDEVQIHPCFRKAVRTVERIRAKSASTEAAVESDEEPNEISQ